jgi:hypothetical protein
MNGPFEIEMKVHLTDGKRGAIATLSFASGVYPSREVMNTRLNEVASEVGNGFRLMTKKEFFNDQIAERNGFSGLGAKFATPGKEDFEPDYVSE